ncbi:MAG: hydroxymethylbilane synthase [Rhodospirillales bacterium]
MTETQLRIGTRGSPLALAQAEETAARLRAAWPDLAPPEAIEIVVVKTTGDRIRDRPLAEIGGKALFAKELEAALLADRIDLAVHSLKDLPSLLPDDFALAAVLPREDPRDTLIRAEGEGGLESLAQGCVIGTCSPRRAAQLLMLRPDLQIATLRGNVETRLAKLKSGDMAATLLGQAGLNRLGMTLGLPLAPEVFLPAATQGVIGLEIRSADRATAKRLAPINDPETWHRSLAERGCLAALGGSCHTPVAAFAEVTGERIELRSLFLLPDGSAPLRRRSSAGLAEAEALGLSVGEALRGDAGAAHLALLED